MEAIAVADGGRNVFTPAFSGMSENKKLGTWLDRLVAEAASKGKPIARMEQLTPALAALLLERNPANRKISAMNVERFAYDIQGGRWAFNGEPIIVSDTGELNDGQNRCQAVVSAGIPIDVILVVGVSRDSRTTLDQGKARTIGDYLAMEGHGNANHLGATANIVWQVQTRGFHSTAGSASATRSEMMNLIADNPGIERSVVLCGTPGARNTAGQSVLAAAHFLIGRKGARHEVDDFAYQVMDGAGLKAGDPALYARNRLINERGRLKPNEKLELLFKAWNARRLGTKVSRLLLTGGVLPVLEV